jgi:hypothetical protein
MADSPAEFDRLGKMISPISDYDATNDQHGAQETEKCDIYHRFPIAEIDNRQAGQCPLSLHSPMGQTHSQNH